MNSLYVMERLAEERRAYLRREAELDRLARQAAPMATRVGILGALNNQLTYLFLSSFVILFVGMGLFPVLPVYDAQFGATRTVIGLHFALMYAANAVGAMLTNRLAARLTQRGLFIASGVIGIPALWLLGSATQLWQVVALTSTLWFCGGVSLALINVFTGLHASRGNRGRSFSLMFLAYPLGSLFGGTTVSQLIAHATYAALFVVLTFVWAALPLIGVLGLKLRHDEKPQYAAAINSNASLGPAFVRLLVIALTSAFAINIGRLGTALSMQALHFAASDIASTATVAGLLTVPSVMLIGALSDRLGRQTFLMLSFAAAAGGALLLSVATQLWMFWLAATLILVALCTNGALLSALIADRLPASAMQRGLPWIQGMNPIAGIAGFIGLGYVMETWGAGIVYAFAAVMALFAAVLLGSLRHTRQATPYRPSGTPNSGSPIGKTA